MKLGATLIIVSAAIAAFIIAGGVLTLPGAAKLLSLPLALVAFGILFLGFDFVKSLGGAFSVPQESQVPNSQIDGDRSAEGVTLNPKEIS